jgi:hypothetical protein
MAMFQTVGPSSAITGGFPSGWASSGGGLRAGAQGIASGGMAGCGGTIGASACSFAAAPTMPYPNVYFPGTHNMTKPNLLFCTGHAGP